jgi:hypothetical protein
LKPADQLSNVENLPSLVKKVAKCSHCGNVERTWTEHAPTVYRCDTCDSLVAAHILWPLTSGITGKKSDDDKISKRGRKPKTPTDPFFVFEQVDGKSVYTGPFKDMAKAQRHAAGHGTVTQQQAIPPGSTVRSAPKVVQPWDVMGEAIATHLFGAKDKAGINAVFGRVGPILHGDKRSGNCNGLIAYEMERQGKDKADLDYVKLAADVAEFWKWHRRVKPTVQELKVCFKVVDAWQEWRGKQKPTINMADYDIVEPDNYISPGPAR